MSMFSWCNLFDRVVNGWQRLFTSKKRTSKRNQWPRTALRLEALEDRCLPSSQQFVSQIYTDLLHRPVDAGGLAYWSSLLNQGASEAQVALSLESSPEYLSTVVENAFTTLLNRPADATGLANWVQYLNNNAPVSAMIANIAASTEFFADAGGTNSGFVNLLYQDLLNRSPDPTGMAAFTGELNAGISTYIVAYQILSSNEYDQDVVASDYLRIFRRPADSGGLDYWAAQLGNGMTQQDLVASLLSSPEYADRAPPTPVVTLPSSAVTIDESSATISGTAQSGSIVLVHNGNQVVGSEQLEGAATAFSISVPLTANSVNDLTVTAATAFGNESLPAVVPAITETNSPITVTPPAAQKNDEGDSVTGVTVTASDIFSGGFTLSYSANNLPPGLQIDSTSGVISGSIQTGDSTGSPYTVTVSASDGAHTGSADFIWTVGVKPTITAPATQGNNEGFPVNLQVVASDADGATLTYSASNLPAGLTIDKNTGIISGNVTTGDSADSPYTVTVSVSDGVDTASANFTWLIDNGTGPSITAPANQTNDETDVVTNVLVVASDSNHAPLTYTASNLPAGLSINKSTGVISGTIQSGDFSSTPYMVTVSASDGVNTSSAQFTWKVGTLPAITTPANQNNNVGDAVSLQVIASDADGAALTYGEHNLPPGLTIDPSTGLITGNITAASTYTATVSVSDGVDTVSANFTWQVGTVTPTVTSPGTQMNADNDPVMLQIVASYANSPTLTYSANNLPPNLAIDPNTGIISGTISATADQNSAYMVTVFAADGNNSGSTQFQWIVTT